MEPKMHISFLTEKEFSRVLSSKVSEMEKLTLIGAMCRLNTFSAVKKAGSGHLGSSFSALDINVYLYFKELNTLKKGLDSPDRDIYFSSKGHDCPGQYAVLFGAGVLSYEKLLGLRRLGGLDGHPDIKIPGMEANTGSLGMGISKGKGMAIAKEMRGNGGRIIVMTGDGELQEGQIWESLQTAAHQGVNNLIALIDHNKIQTDKQVKEIADIGNIKAKFEAFGWHVERCDGHDFLALQRCFAKLQNVKTKPKALIADTVKGKGISFMEGPESIKNNNGIYQWHSGAPDDDTYEKGFKELLARVEALYLRAGLEKPLLKIAETREKGRVALKSSSERVVSAYEDALYKIGKKRKDLVVLDADLAADCGLGKFAKAFPKRFIENGIAEQDMVSAAGGLALRGFLPVVNSFGVFLASRANEQIYNNATENTKIIYVCHYAGLIPAGPGKSHQSLRDISLFGALPNCVIIEPANALETKQATQWCVEKAKVNCMMRLAISPSPRTICLPEKYELEIGKGSVLRDGKDAVLFAYGPVMLNEALIASELLEKENFSLKVVDMPWLNRVNEKWLKEVAAGCKSIFVLDNHAPVGGLGDSLLNAIISSEKSGTKRFHKFAVEGCPACGTPAETLKYHGLNGEGLARRIIGRRPPKMPLK